MTYIIALVGILIALVGGALLIDKNYVTVEEPTLEDADAPPIQRDQIPQIEVSKTVPTETPRPSGVTVDMSYQGLTKVPGSIFEKRGTEILNLSHNAFTGALPAEVRHLSMLRVLDLSDNQFTGIPAEVGQLANLEVLDVSNNPITGLPYELGNLKKLQTLDLRGTQYATADLAIIRQQLPQGVTILVDE